MDTVYSIGHSNHSLEGLCTLLQNAGIRRVADVRSQPYSRRFPHFGRRPLSVRLWSLGIDYVFLGDTLGGRPHDRACYRADGSVDYARRAGAADFRDGVERLQTLAAELPTAMLCAEEDPARCHRRLLVTPALQTRGLRVVHVRGDGRLQDDDETSGGAGQLALFR